MKNIAVLALVLGITLSGVGSTTKWIYPYRWVRVGAGLRNDADVEKIRIITPSPAGNGTTWLRGRIRMHGSTYRGG